MPIERKLPKKYEPPMVREIGGVFEQAMGVTNCTTGVNFQVTCAVGGTFGQNCSRGAAPSGSCSRGTLDQTNICAAGPGVATGACTAGFRATGGCSRGTQG